MQDELSSSYAITALNFGLRRERVHAMRSMASVPLFILCLLFEQTKQLFQKWLLLPHRHDVLDGCAASRIEHDVIRSSACRF